MKRWLLPRLVSPETGEPLTLVERSGDANEVHEGELRAASGRTYPIVRGIPRFVETHYAGSFGFQWNAHRSTQLDNERHRNSEQRFWTETGFARDSLAGKLVLDAGSGSGRFSRVAADAGAFVVAVDLSEAVEPNHQNLAQRPNVTVVQASLFDLPFREGTFDAAFTLGVIQHTPDPLRALREIAVRVKRGGAIGVNWYTRHWYSYLHQKYIIRFVAGPLLRRVSDRRLYGFVRWYTPKLLRVSRALHRSGVSHRLVDRIVPVANRDWVGDLTEGERIEWSVLDTFDWYSPRYDKPQRPRDVERVLREAGFSTRATQGGMHGERSRGG